MPHPCSSEPTQQRQLHQGCGVAAWGAGRTTYLPTQPPSCSSQAAQCQHHHCYLDGTCHVCQHHDCCLTLGHAMCDGNMRCWRVRPTYVSSCSSQARQAKLHKRCHTTAKRTCVGKAGVDVVLQVWVCVINACEHSTHAARQQRDGSRCLPLTSRRLPVATHQAHGRHVSYVSWSMLLGTHMALKAKLFPGAVPWPSHSGRLPAAP